MINRYSNDNILAFHTRCNFKESWGGEGQCGQKKRDRKKNKAKEEKLCQDPSLFHREISLLYGFAVNGNTETICCSATFNLQWILKKSCSVLFRDSIHTIRFCHCSLSPVAFSAPPVVFELSTFSLFALCLFPDWLDMHPSQLHLCNQQLHQSPLWCEVRHLHTNGAETGCLSGRPAQWGHEENIRRHCLGFSATLQLWIDAVCHGKLEALVNE